MKVAYLHGLESPNYGTKVDWLNENDKSDWNANNTRRGAYGHRTPVEQFKYIFNHFELGINQTNELYERLS